MTQHSVQAVVLAAGKSTRFGTGQSKQLVPLCGMPMVGHALELLYSLSIDTTVVLGYQAEEIERVMCGAKWGKKVTVAHQVAQNGTGGAVQCAVPHLHADHILIVNGDMPLLNQEVISSFMHHHVASGNAITFCTTDKQKPAGYGRVLRDDDGQLAIREEKECSTEQCAITTVNAGVYLVARSFLLQALEHLSYSSVTGEKYITDIVAFAARKKQQVSTYSVNEQYVSGVNTLEELAAAEQVLYNRTRRRLMQHGVRMSDPSSILIDRGVRVGRGTVIGRGTHLQGDTIIGKNVTIEPYCILRDTHVADAAQILSHSVIHGATIASGAHIGPFARLRGRVQVEQGAVIGNFVEVKNSQIGPGSKAKHLSYIGDATVERDANIGAGAITCNYDGQTKHHTRIGAASMIGANTSMVAPVSIGANAYVAAGSTVTKDVPSGALAIGRARQLIKNDWVRTRALLRAGAVRALEREAGNE